MESENDETPTMYSTGLKQYIMLAIIILAFSLSLLFILRERGTISFSPLNCDSYLAKANIFVKQVSHTYEVVIGKEYFVEEPKILEVALTFCRNERGNQCSCNF